MSADTQRTLDDYERARVEDGPSVGQLDDTHSGSVSASAWTPTEQPKRQCQGCGAHVSLSFARRAGDRNNRVHGCPKCCNFGELARGAAWDPDHDDRVKGGKR